MNKKILVLGAGAQGIVIIKMMNEHSMVDELVCIDADDLMFDELTSKFKKLKCFKIDCSEKENITDFASKYKFDIFVNCLPISIGKPVMDAAIELKVNYQDLAISEYMITGEITDDWVEGAKYLQTFYNKKFIENKKLAIVGTGVSPGLLCVLTRKAVEDLDSCETIYNLFYEGVDTKKFIPFWFSPDTALRDMEENGFAFIDGKFTSTPGFSDPILRKYDYMHREIEFVEHRHEEPLIYGLNASKYYKGLKNAYFKYSGVGIDFAKQMARVGLLTKKRFLYKGIRIHPLNFLEFLISKTPKSEKEIADIIKEGFYSDVLYAVVEVHGKKNKKDIRIEMHIFSPGLAESFRMKKMTAEQFLTAQSAGAYTKMMVEDKFQNHGLIFSDELNPTQIDQYLDEVEKLGITYEKRTINVKQQIKA